MRRALDAFAGKNFRLRALRVLAAAASIATIAAPPLAGPTFSYPTDSPSARAAARLKNRPPRNWIRHYLGEDRYKIAGGTWKFVSTELDRFYYPPYAAEMLRQSPNRVIGFSSAQDAQEAGYLPAPGYSTNPSFDPAYAGIGRANTRAASQRVTLADGVSTALLPAGWQHVGDKGGQGVPLSIDMFVRGNDPNRGLVIMTMTLPPSARGRSAENFLSAANVQSLLGGVASSGSLNSTQANALRDARTTRTTLGGLRGVAITSRNPAVMRREGRAIIVGRGNKLFIAQETPRRAPGTAALLSSLRLR